MKRKIFNALIGFGAGVFTAPIAVIVWPIALAWFMCANTDAEDGI